MGKLLTFVPAPNVGLEDAYDALNEADALICFAMDAFMADSVDYLALERCGTVIGAILDGIETTMVLDDMGIERPDRTYHGDDDGE